MIEKAVSFGPGGCLMGILTEPDPGAARADAPAVLLWNVGINHRVGPFRFFVDLARRLAAAGFTTLRFDASGLGDSEVRREAVSDRERAALDLKDAMGLLEARKQAKRFVLVGFCSSVDAAHATALADPRVAAVAYIEGYTCRTAGYYLRYPRRLLSGARWRRFFKRHLGRLFPGTALRATGEREEIFLRDYPTRAQFSRDLHALVGRGVRLLFLYVAGDSEYAYRDQLFEMYGQDLRGRIELEYYPQADHTFFRLADREKALTRVVGWVAAAFSGQRAA